MEASDLESIKPHLAPNILLNSVSEVESAAILEVRANGEAEHPRFMEGLASMLANRLLQATGDSDRPQPPLR